jgi:uncharacterized RDD family membrane protein YckC
VLYVTSLVLWLVTGHRTIPTYIIAWGLIAAVFYYGAYFLTMGGRQHG